MNLPTQAMLSQRFPLILWGGVSLLFLMPLSTQAVTATTPASNTTLTAYKVQSGDTLRGVANKFNLSVADLAKYNNKQITDKLAVGEVLLLSGDDVAKVVSKIKPDALTYVSAKTTSTGQASTYVVKSGETINGIANRNNTTPTEILRLNNLTADSKIIIGQKLLLPAPIKASSSVANMTSKEVAKASTKASTATVLENKTSSKPTPKLGETQAKATVKITEYTVANGDSLIKLANRYNISLSDLAKMNQLKTTDSLKIGQKILVPIAVVNATGDKKY